MPHTPKEDQFRKNAAPVRHNVLGQSTERSIFNLPVRKCRKRSLMRNLILFGFIFMLLMLNCMAVAPLQLSGSTGEALLAKVSNNTTNQTVQANETKAGLWSWGKVPVGHLLNPSGGLISKPLSTDPEGSVPLESKI
jgi:hypothetical protein